MSGIQTATDRLALTLITEASVCLIETKKWADRFIEKNSKDDINTEAGIEAANLALEETEAVAKYESTPGETMEEIEAKLKEEKAAAEEAEALRQMAEAPKLSLANPLGMLHSRMLTMS